MMAEISVLPVSRDEKIGKYVAEAVRIIDESGLDYRLTPMGTVIVGDWEAVMNVAKQCHEKVMEMTDRVITKIRIDDARDKQEAFDDRIKHVEELVGKKIKT